jgi:hypothetical protein
VSALRSFDPRQDRSLSAHQAVEVAKAAKAEVRDGPAFAAFASFRAGDPASEHDVAPCDIICRAENAFSPDVMADGAELMIQDELP